MFRRMWDRDASSDERLQMAADTALGVVPPLPASDEQSNTLFTYEVAHDRRLITRLVGIDLDGEGHSVRVAAEIYPIHAPQTSDPQWRFYDFPTREKAQHFVEESLLALEYLGCTVSESRTHLAGNERSSAVAAASVA
jgi:hypothetical protein